MSGSARRGWPLHLLESLRMGFYLECETCVRLWREDALAGAGARTPGSALSAEVVQARVEAAREAIRAHEVEAHPKEIEAAAGAS